MVAGPRGLERTQSDRAQGPPRGRSGQVTSRGHRCPQRVRLRSRPSSRLVTAGTVQSHHDPQTADCSGGRNRAEAVQHELPPPFTDSGDRPHSARLLQPAPTLTFDTKPSRHVSHAMCPDLTEASSRQVHGVSDLSGTKPKTGVSFNSIEVWPSGTGSSMFPIRQETLPGARLSRLDCLLPLPKQTRNFRL